MYFFQVLTNLGGVIDTYTLLEREISGSRCTLHPDPEEEAKKEEEEEEEE